MTFLLASTNGSSATVNHVSTPVPASVPEPHSVSRPPPTPACTTSLFPPLSPDQYQCLLSLLSSSSSSTSASSSVNHLTTYVSSVKGNCPSISFSNFFAWIIDSGATDHVCCSLDLFSSHHSIPPLSVHLPTGSNAIASFSGNVHLSSDLVLHNVLCIPSFLFNIVSVSRLTSSLNCHLTFSSTSCQIHLLQPSMMIGTAKIFEGLYFLHADMSPSPVHMAAVSSASDFHL